MWFYLEEASSAAFAVADADGVAEELAAESSVDGRKAKASCTTSFGFLYQLESSRDTASSPPLISTSDSTAHFLEYLS